MSVLKLGSTGPEVKQVESKLKRLGFDPGKIDETFTDKTQSAVIKFQTKQMIEIDGKVGPETQRTLKAALQQLDDPSLMAPASVAAFAKKLADVAEGQFDKFHGDDEADGALCPQIKTYFETIGATFTSCTNQAWSAAFVSFCVKKAGATADEFDFSAAHSVFVHAAIKNTVQNKGVFHGLRIGSTALKVGDILQVNRGGTKHDYDFARDNTNYASHSAVVVSVVRDGADSHAFTIGGNEGDSVRRTRVRLTAAGFVQQRSSNPYIAIVRRVA